MNAYDIHDIVKKIVGKIYPVGETNEDSRRFENLQEMTKLVNHLLSDIDEVASLKDRQEYSIKKAGEHASKFITDVGIN